MYLSGRGFAKQSSTRSGCVTFMVRALGLPGARSPLVLSTQSLLLESRTDVTRRDVTNNAGL